MATALRSRSQFPVLLLFLALAFLAAAGGAMFAPGAWYASLVRPSFAPPNWLFGPVWTVLYIMIAVSGWMVWRQAGWRSPALRWWGLQLALNALWTPLFFGLQRIDLALICIGLMWLAIVMTVVRFWRLWPLAGMMLLPYLAWVSFASALNFAFWWLNG